MKINGASSDGRRMVDKSPNGCVMKVINSTDNDLGNYTCKITAEVQNDYDVGYTTMTVSRAVGRSENPGVPVVIRCA